MKCLTAIAALAIASLAVPANAATFLFIRHAESTANAGTATTVGEFTDPPLTALGQQQALDLVDTLVGYDITSIYTSAYQRTQLTIEPTASLRGLTPTIDGRTNEWYLGDVDSLAELGDIDFYSIIGAWAAGDTAAKADLPNAESLDDMVARVLPAWEEITDAHRDEDGTVVLVGHGAEMGYVMPYFARNVDLDFAFANGLSNTGIIEVNFDGDDAVVTDWQGVTPPVAPVPLPASGSFLLAGLGALSVAVRRKRADRQS